VSSSPGACPACGAPLPDEPALCGVDRLHGIPGSFEVRVCPACGSGRTFPFVGPDELGRLYPETYNAYSMPSSPVARALATALFRWYYRRLLARPPFEHLRRIAPGRLLDVGAGRGDLGVVSAEQGWHVTGLEPSAEACEEGRRRGVEMVEGTLGDASADALGRGYDAIVFQHALEHVAEPRDDLLRAHELLRPGGVLLAAVPNFGSWQRRRFGDAWFHLDLPRHRSHFTAAGLERALVNCGFDRVELTTMTTRDGLPNSVQYRLFGKRRFRAGLSLYATSGLSVALMPVSGLANALGGGGDELGAAAVRSAAS
jgi:SAM-dependent methyltransferase